MLFCSFILEGKLKCIHILLNNIISRNFPAVFTITLGKLYLLPWSPGTNAFGLHMPFSCLNKSKIRSKNVYFSLQKDAYVNTKCWKLHLLSFAVIFCRSYLYVALEICLGWAFAFYSRRKRSLLGFLRSDWFLSNRPKLYWNVTGRSVTNAISFLSTYGHKFS